MADFDKYDYEINKRLPEWYKHVNGLEPINRYTQELLISILEGFLKNLGLVQPIQVWKTLPEEYNWEHKYYNKDIWVGNTTLNEKADLKISNDKPLFLKIPNTKRPTDAVIDIHFTGNKNNQTKPIKKLLVKNADQMILFKNITTKTSIKINTDGNILIDGVNKDDLIDGKIYKIKPIARNDKYDDVSIDDENKKTQLELYVDIPPITINGQDTPDEVKLEAKITNKKPIYVTEQNVRLYTVSAFPLKSVKLYGFFCHDFNNKQEWKLLWEKEYSENTRTVYDRITKQYDCERFYVQVQYYGLGLPISIGFPQEQYSSDVSFQINDRLDYWGAIYGLPRRHYKPHITEDEEPYTFPKYYAYPIEQDYWYEERLVSEYRRNINAKDIDFLKDSEDNNIALMKNIDPYLNDVWIYTETITPTIDMSAETKGILPCSVKQDETTDGVSWKNEQRVGDTQLLTSDLHLEPQNAKNYNNRSFMGKVLQLKFKVPELPKDIEITGLELKLKGVTDLHSDTIILDNRSNFKLPFKYEKANGDKFVKKETFLLNMFDGKEWQKGQKYFTFGGKNNLLGLDKIERYQLEDPIEFNIGLTNQSNFLMANISLYNIKLYVYYKTLTEEFTINEKLSNRKMFLYDDNDNPNITINQETNEPVYNESAYCDIVLTLENTGVVPVTDKTVYIIPPYELEVLNGNDSFSFDLDVGEKLIIGNDDSTRIRVVPRDKLNTPTGLFDVLIFCDDKVLKNEIILRRKNKW